MLQLELPHVNVLSKVDLIEKYGKLGMKRVDRDLNVQNSRANSVLVDFNLEYYADVLDLKYIRKALKKVGSEVFALRCKTVADVPFKIRRIFRQNLPSYPKYCAKSLKTSV